MKNLHYIIILITIAIFATISFVWSRKDASDSKTQVSLVGCYQATTNQDVYTLNIKNQEGNVVSGSLTFKNFQKDSSSGSFSGSYANNVLTGDYVFKSEGMNSVIEVAFKKSGDTFVRGVGDMSEDGVHFVDLETVIYDDSSSLNNFKKVACPEVAATQISFPVGGEIFSPGKTYELKWAPVAGQETVSISLVNTTTLVAADKLYGVPNSGSYQYSFPLGLDAGRYEFRIGDGTSNIFTIVGK